MEFSQCHDIENAQSNEAGGPSVPDESLPSRGMQPASTSGIKRAFPDYLVSDNGRGEDSLSSIQDMATQLQGMGVDNITIIPKGDGWALEIGAGM